MARQRRRKRAQQREERRAERAARQANPLMAKAFATGIDRMYERQQKALEAGKFKKAAKIGGRISNRIMKNPMEAFGIEQGIAQKQFEANVAANRPDQFTVGGSQITEVDPITGKTVVRQALDEDQQELQDQTTQIRGTANNMFMNALQGMQFGQPLGFGNLPEAPQTSDLGAQRAEYENRLYDSEAAQINKQRGMELEQLKQDLYNRGVPLSQMDQRPEMKAFNERYQNQFDQARTKAMTQAGQEFERSFNIGQAGRSSALNEQLLGRQVPQQELGFLAGFTGGPTAMPNFMGFQPIQYQMPQFSPFVQMGIQNQMANKEFGLSEQQLDLQRQQAAMNRAGSGAPSYSFGGLPPTMEGVPQGAGSPVVNKAITGANQGFIIGATS